jgi:hypothetical protein
MAQYSKNISGVKMWKIGFSKKSLSAFMNLHHSLLLNGALCTYLSIFLYKIQEHTKHTYVHGWAKATFQTVISTHMYIKLTST